MPPEDGNPVPTPNRDDDSLQAAQVDINGAKARITKIESILNNPDKLAELLAESVKKSSVLRKTLSDAMLELFNDHDTRIELKKILLKIDRESLWRWGKYVAGGLVWLATVVAAIFAYVQIKN